jgi:16S rRNA (cytosine967-C5)-methyltransferase
MARPWPAPIAPSEPAAGRAALRRPGWRALAAIGRCGREEAAALLGRAPLDVRVNTLKADRPLDLPEPASPTRRAAMACACPPARRSSSGRPIANGLIEVQDAGSQLACEALAAQPGETVIDLCAGAGGKTLALAAAMENRGTLIACDTDRGRLSRLPRAPNGPGRDRSRPCCSIPAARRERWPIWQGKADAVLVDAPCSGTGTWRRNPEARWRLTPRELARYAALQARLLDVAAGLVRPGGRLVYRHLFAARCRRRGAGRGFLAAIPAGAPTPALARRHPAGPAAADPGA